MRSRTGRWGAALHTGACEASADTDEVEALRAEMQGRGWIAVAARTEAGDLDRFVVWEFVERDLRFAAEGRTVLVLPDMPRRIE